MHFFALRPWYNMPSHTVEILTLSNSHNLFKNLGALSESAKSLKEAKDWPNSKFFEILILWIGWFGRKTISSYCPFEGVGRDYFRVQGTANANELPNKTQWCCDADLVNMMLINQTVLKNVWVPGKTICTRSCTGRRAGRDEPYCTLNPPAVLVALTSPCPTQCIWDEDMLPTYILR